MTQVDRAIVPAPTAQLTAAEVAEYLMDLGGALLLVATVLLPSRKLS